MSGTRGEPEASGPVPYPADNDKEVRLTLILPALLPLD